MNGDCSPGAAPLRKPHNASTTEASGSPISIYRIPVPNAAAGPMSMLSPDTPRPKNTPASSQQVGGDSVLGQRAHAAIAAAKKNNGINDHCKDMDHLYTIMRIILII